MQRQLDDVVLITMPTGDSGRLVALRTGGEQTLAEYARDRAEQAVGALRSGNVAVVQTRRADATGLTSYELHRDAPPTVLGTIDRPNDDLDVAVDGAGGLLALDGSVLDTWSGTEIPLSGGNGLAAGTVSVFADRGTLLVRATSRPGTRPARSAPA